MSTLVVHYNGLAAFPFDRWLADADGGVVLLGAREKIERAGESVPTGRGGYRHLEVLADFADEALVRRRAVELAERFGARRVIGFHEADVDRAAAVRERLELPGLRPADVLPFRDKPTMKARLTAAGLEVAPHTLAVDSATLRAFRDRWGLPLVLKERAGFGSINLRIVRDDAELAALTGLGPGLLAEAYVPGKMCHVDGLVVAGRVVSAWPSQYQYDLSSFATDPHPRIDLTLDPGDPLTPRLLDVTARALAALSDAPQTHGFHAEIFHTPDDRLVICEVAARPGGARIREIFTALFGFNLAEYAARAEAGLPLPLLDGRSAPPVPRQMAGQLALMKRPGRVVSVPAVPRDEWLVYAGVFARPGQLLTGPDSSADFVSAAVGTAPTRAQCEQRLRQLGTRIERELVLGA